MNVISNFIGFLTYQFSIVRQVYVKFEENLIQIS